MSSVSSLDVCNWAYEGQLRLIQAAVGKDGSLISQTDSDLRTALHWACSAGKLEVVNFLIANGAQVRLHDCMCSMC